MSFTKKTVKDLNLTNKTVLVRADYNVALTPDGKVSDWYRVKESLPTLEYLLRQNCKIVVMSHLGRPEGRVNRKLSLEPIAKKLQKLLKHPVFFVQDCVGEDIAKRVEALQPGQILLLENLRFHREEETNNKHFAKQLASLADVFVQDGFGVVHRAHASTQAITKFLPSVAGLLLTREVSNITSALEQPKQPLVAVLGGAKVSDKIALLHNLLTKADTIIIGGAMANTFLVAMGVQVGRSVYESTAVSQAQAILKAAQKRMQSGQFEFYLPSDGVGAKSLASRERPLYQNWHGAAEIYEHAPLPFAEPNPVKTVLKPDVMLLDLGSNSLKHASQVLNSAKTVIWNGPVGYTELPQFRAGTLAVVKAIVDSGATSIVGGGDTAAFVEQAGLSSRFSWVSTGGGASLELMAGHKLPGVEALLDK